MAQENTYKWVQDRLRELQSGTIAAGDRHRLAELAKEDPFVADALEGYALHPDVDHTVHLQSLTNRIREKKRVRRRWLIPNLTVTAVAASLILIVGFWAVMSRLSDDDQEEAVAVHEITLDSDGYVDSLITDTTEVGTIAAAEPERAKAVQPAPSIRLHSTESVFQRKESPESTSSIPGTMNYPSPPVAEREEIIATETLDDKDMSVSESARAKTAEEDANIKTQTLAQEGYYANQISPELMKSRVTGRVMSKQGEPLIGASVIVRGSNQATISDEQGKFELYLPKPESDVDIAYSGFADTTVNMKQGDADKLISLKQDYFMETVAIGKGGRNRKLQDAAPIMNSIPYDAEDNLLFIEYLRRESKYPVADSSYNAAKMVTVDFLIDEKGHASQVNVVQTSYSKLLDDEAVRLIKKGPVWECVGRSYPCRGKFTIYFK